MTYDTNIGDWVAIKTSEYDMGFINQFIVDSVIYKYTIKR